MVFGGLGLSMWLIGGSWVCLLCDIRVWLFKCDKVDYRINVNLILI